MTTQRAFGRHCLALLFPGLALLFCISGPHATWRETAAWHGVIVLYALLAGSRARTDHELAPDVARWPFTALVLVLAALQLINVVLLARLIGACGLLSYDGLLAIALVGGSSGSGIVVSHELIHHTSPPLRQLGRLLLATVCYEHFYTEHVRGHHVRVGTPEDPATAHYGESFFHFLRRRIPGQFRSAWALERGRLSSLGAPPLGLRNRVVQGALVGCAIWLVLGASFGPQAMVAHLLQAAWGVLTLEVTNYIEHWGLSRRTTAVGEADAWDTNSWHSTFSLIGLCRHADHHMIASRPYHLLRLREGSPKMPGSYNAIGVMALLDNARYQRLMTEELRRRQLGPFATPNPAA